MNAITTFRAAEAYIRSFYNAERNLSSRATRVYRLERMQRLLELFDHPEKSFQSLHIAGSKGKGSTAVLLASVLGAAGFKTGLYTSPHISDIRERIMIDNRKIHKRRFMRILETIRLKIEANFDQKSDPDSLPTFFEILTLLALQGFREAKCRYAVLETGLGGRLDATNTVTPLAAILTPIELEHTDILGDTLEKIAAEKCGVIKPGIPVISGRQVEAVTTIISQTAQEKQAPMFSTDTFVTINALKTSLKKTEFVLSLPEQKSLQLALGLKGDFQAENAALAFTVIKKIFPFIADKAIRAGFAQASLPGRMEIVLRKPLVIVDGAHTPGSVERVARMIHDLTKPPRILLFAAAGDKKYQQMAEILAPLFDAIIITTPGSFKESSPLEIQSAFKYRGRQVIVEFDPALALQKALLHAGKNKVVLVTGSFYLVGDIKRLLGK